MIRTSWEGEKKSCFSCFVPSFCDLSLSLFSITCMSKPFRDDGRNEEGFMEHIRFVVRVMVTHPQVDNQMKKITLKKLLVGEKQGVLMYTPRGRLKFPICLC